MTYITKRLLIKSIASLPLFGISSPTQAQELDNLEKFKQAQAKSNVEYKNKILANFPYEILIVDGKNAYYEWERIKNIGTHWPIILGDERDAYEILVAFEPEMYSNGTFINFDNSTSTTKSIVSEANSINFPEDLKNWDGITPLGELDAPKGKWPTENISFEDGITIDKNIISNKFYEKVSIVLLPTKNGWEAPAYLNWGNWNACPPAKYHVAALKKWHDLYGAEVISLSDTLELKIKNRPKDKKSAFKLADELYYYCPDILDQGFDTKANLAYALMNSNFWSIWWD